jgi:prepilin-type N-terminal cleavage/methylation domain-containing protein
MKSQQGGFTLVEMAIVLVIIGLLLGGILKGQELINSAKVKNLANDFRVVPTYIYAYQDKFRALPGDDPAAVAHLGAGSTQLTGAAIGNGVVNGEWRSTTATDESFIFWEHVRRANLASGATNPADATYAPLNVEGGRIGVTSASNSPNSNILKGSYVVCSDGILGKFAKQLDTTLDNGDTATGNVAVFVNSVTGVNQTAVTNMGASPTIDDNIKYSVCLAF